MTNLPKVSVALLDEEEGIQIIITDQSYEVAVNRAIDTYILLMDLGNVSQEERDNIRDFMVKEV